MDKREISNITSYFQVIKSTAKVSADSEQILGEKIVVNKSPVKVRVPDKTFLIQNGLKCTHGLTMMK